ncbi:hypothetical protein PCYB_041020 [Plasmodium cynomolgi strain B]|uniref:Uncharacterized protein n=1 Tax=Plasmodium cynomolgi (strain B) TaxID=1120755 RepID=K6USG5_PLACD|nr:hypothetical protein PCYB_041020 [Plasmodium cynomolgi strain B]GAB64900.1 hypothetical protein PCYB_041020 [Plasmodium cynomolgi strain B]
MNCLFFVKILTVPFLIWIHRHHRTYNGTVTESLKEKLIQNDLNPYFQCGRWLAEGEGNAGEKSEKAKTVVSTEGSTSGEVKPPEEKKEENKMPKKEEGETDKTVATAVNDVPLLPTGIKEIIDLLTGIIALNLEEQKLKFKLFVEEIKLNDMVEKIKIKNTIKLNAEKDLEELSQIEENFMINYRKHKIQLKGIKKKIELKKKLLKYRIINKIIKESPKGENSGNLTKEDLIELEIIKVDEQVERLIQNGGLPPAGKGPLKNEEKGDEDGDKANKNGKSKGKAKMIN